MANPLRPDDSSSAPFLLAYRRSTPPALMIPEAPAHWYPAGLEAQSSTHVSQGGTTGITTEPGCTGDLLVHQADLAPQSAQAKTAGILLPDLSYLDLLGEDSPLAAGPTVRGSSSPAPRSLTSLGNRILSEPSCASSSSWMTAGTPGSAGACLENRSCWQVNSPSLVDPTSSCHSPAMRGDLPAWQGEKPTSRMSAGQGARWGPRGRALHHITSPWTPGRASAPRAHQRTTLQGPSSNALLASTRKSPQTLTQCSDNSGGGGGGSNSGGGGGGSMPLLVCHPTLDAPALASRGCQGSSLTKRVDFRKERREASTAQEGQDVEHSGNATFVLSQRTLGSDSLNAAEDVDRCEEWSNRTMSNCMPAFSAQVRSIEPESREGGGADMALRGPFLTPWCARTTPGTPEALGDGNMCELEQKLELIEAHRRASADHCARFLEVLEKDLEVQKRKAALASRTSSLPESHWRRQFHLSRRSQSDRTLRAVRAPTAQVEGFGLEPAYELSPKAGLKKSPRCFN